MISRFLLLGVAAVLASASPITLTFTGVADGVLGSTSFTQADFTIVFTSDTDDLSRPPSFPVDWSTPAGTPGIFAIMISGGPILTGSFTDDQAVFVHPAPENDIGIWHYNTADWLAKQDSAFSSYDLRSSIGPVSTGVNGWPGVLPDPAIPGSTDSHFTTTEGNFVLSNVSSLTFTADVTPGAPTPSTVPEPSTATFLLMGIGGLVAGTLRRKR